MKLSILMPSHNYGTRAYINILNACTMGHDDVEVIIRDNSGNSEKREFLSRIQEKNCRILSVDECTAEENAKALLDAAKGDFVLFSCDDDTTNAHTVPAMLKEINRISEDPDIIGTTGNFIREEEAYSQHIRFQNFDRPTAIERFNGYFPETNYAIFQYSPIRRTVHEEVWRFLRSVPVRFSHGDIMMNCMFLMHGRMTYIDRFFYQYVNKNWADDAVSMQSDMPYFRAAGLDVSGTRIQWLIGLFEGALTCFHKYQGVTLPQDQRNALATHWYQSWFPHFVHTLNFRAPEGGRFDAQAITLGQKWCAQADVRFPELLDDIVTYFSLSSQDVAQRYYDFWK